MVMEWLSAKCNAIRIFCMDNPFCKDTFFFGNDAIEIPSANGNFLTKKRKKYIKKCKSICQAD